MRLAVVVPCYDEEAVLPHTLARLGALLTRLVAEGLVDARSRLVFVDDGSRDATWRLLAQATRDDVSVNAVRLSRNRGHQRALLAGLAECGEADAVVSIDADLQDDVDAIVAMVRAHQAGADIVYGVRSARASDTAFKRVTAQGYYRLLAALGVELVFDHADFRLMSRRALDALLAYGESNLFLRGLVPQLGFTTTVVHYTRRERLAGESKYPLRRMLAFAWEGVTSLTVTPLRAITALGLVGSAVTSALGLWALGVRLFTSHAVPGWASTLVPLAFLAAAQMLALGVIGEYIGKIYLETKRRPAYFISERAGRPPAPREAAGGRARPARRTRTATRRSGRPERPRNT